MSASIQGFSQDAYRGERHNTKTAIDSNLRTRIELARVIAISAIVFHHIRIPSELSLFTWSNLGYARGYLQIGVFKTATAVLTLISGYLLFSSSFELRPARFLKKKFWSLFVPLLLWNIPGALLLLAFQENGHFLSKYDTLSDGSILNWANALFGLTHEPANEPLQFLRNLLACNFVALLIANVFRKHSTLLLAVIALVAFFHLGRPIVTRDDILLAFFLGAFAAVAKIDYKTIDFLTPIALPFFLISAFAMFYWQISYESTIGMMHRLLSVLAVWPVIGYISRHKVCDVIVNYSHYTFFTFLAHYYVSLVLFFAWSQIAGMQQFYIYFLLAGPVTIAVCLSGQRAISKLAPGPLSIATGGRL